MSTAVNAARTTGLHCPGRLSPIGTGVPTCPSCGIWLAGPQAAEIRWIDKELTRVDTARTSLISRRAQLLDDLTRLRRQMPAISAEAEPGQLVPADPEAPQAAAPAVRRQRPEISGRAAARLLLGAGAALVAIAITIFTVAGWSRIGPLGRCAILLAVTAGVLALPRLLVRRQLLATAEAVAATGLVLTIGDAYLVHRFTGQRTGPLTAAGLCAAGAAAWAAYGTVTRLRGPRLAAIGLVQLIAPLAFASIADLLGGPVAPIAGPAAGLVITSGVDIMLAGLLSRSRRPQPDEAARHGQRHADSQVAAVAAAVAWACGVVAAVTGLAVLLSWQGAQHGVSLSDAAWLALVFWAAAVVGTAGTGRRAELASLARAGAFFAGALAGIGLAVVAIPALDASWELVCAGACGLCLSVAALTVGPRSGRSTVRRRDFAAGSAALLAAAAAVVAPAAVAGLVPACQVLPAWSGSGAARTGQATWPYLPAAITVLTLCALGCLLAPYGRTVVPARFRSPAAIAGLTAAAVAAGSLPAVTGLTGWAALIELTAATVIMLTAGAMARDRTFATIAAGCGYGIALTAAAWSLAGRATTVAELAALAVAFGLLATRARYAGVAVLSTAGAVAAATGLAWAAPLAAGWTAELAALPALGVAVAAVALATPLRRARPLQAVVLDAGAGLAALLAALVSAGRPDVFAVVAVTSALVSSCTAWLRAGRQRLVAAATAAWAALAAILAHARPLGGALLTPAQILWRPWRQPGPAVGIPHPAGLSFAIVVFALCLAALAAAAGAWRGSSRVSMDAVAVALPLVAAPAGLAGLDGGLGYVAVVGALLALTLGLTAWAALGESLAPAWAALLSAALTITWALAEPLPTVTVLGCLAACYALCAWRSWLPVVRNAASCLSVLSSAAFAEAATLAAGLPVWQAALAALGIGAAAQIAAVLIRGTATGLAVEVAGWLAAAAGVIGCLGRPWTASAAMAIAGITGLGVAVRPERRVVLWPGLTLCYAAWCTGLAAGAVSVPEPYSVPAGLIAIAAAWRASRSEPRPHSWLAYGPGLALLLLPSLVVAWLEAGWIRPVLTGLAAIGIAVAGARTRTQAPLLTGTAVTVLVAGRALAPDVMRLVHAMPGWVPVAAGGAVLLWAGATYEVRLRNLQAIRRSLAAMT